jgi:type IV pilus assembly protein PilC
MPLIKRRLKPHHRTLLLRQLALLCGNGHTMDQAFRRLARHNESSGVRSFCRSMLEKTGRSDIPDELFDPLMVQLLNQCSENAAMAATLAEGLHEMADASETTAQYDKSLKSALVYPLAIFSVFIVVLAVILVFVIPVFESLFSGYGGRLPEMTRTVLETAGWFKTHGGFVAAGIAVILLIFIKAPRSRMLLTWIVPGLRKVMQDVAAIHFSRLFALLLRLGLPLEAAFQMGAQSLAKTAFGLRLTRHGAPVTDLAGLKAALKASGVFTESLTSLIDCVERPDALPKIFGDFSTYLSKGFDAQLKKTYRQIEVAAFLMTAVVIGTAVIAMYLPIFRMAGAIG